MTNDPQTSLRPRGFQFRLSTLLVAMTCVGLACAALAMPTALWAGIMFSIALMALLTAVLLAIYGDGSQRALAVGYLVFAGGYLACLLATDRTIRGANNDATMPMSRLANRVYFATHANHRRSVTVQTGVFSVGPGGTTLPPTHTVQMSVYNLEDFGQIVHSITAMLLGFVGAIVAIFLHRKNRREVPAE